ncbi:MAG: hypothetical protein ACP5G0_07565 [Desulfomonilia bacterium]
MVGVHLCQPHEHASCAACCGIYNYVENTRSSLVQRFRYRTRLFSMVRQGRISVHEYKDIIRHREDSKRIYSTIYTCEFVGFLDTREHRVGCLLHPMGNRGEDLRDNSFYGRDLCEGHFCPSYQKLDRNEAEIVLETIHDWYLYGIVITDIDFIKTFFRIVQDRLGEHVKADRVSSSERTVHAVQTFFLTKLVWPFRDTMRPRFGKYYFIGEEYDIDAIDYQALGMETSPYDKIFLSLSSSFRSREELTRAEAYVSEIVEEFCDGYERLG